MKTSIIGMGEVGSALYEILKEKYVVKGFDKGKPEEYECDIMHVCIPHSDDLPEIVKAYSDMQKPKLIVVHSSVKVGTTNKIREAVGVPCFHSPIRGRHPNMKEGILTYVKYVSYNTETWCMDAMKIAGYFSECGVRTKIVKDTKVTELMKLLELSRYGVYLAFAKEQESICEHFGMNYETVVNEYERTRSEGLEKLGLGDLRQPILVPFKDFVGGHCTVEDMDLLLDQKETRLLKLANEIDRNTRVWGACNIFKTAKIGKGCSIGHGCEIGNNVVIGDRVRIGAMCFIPEGVTIEDDCFIAPKVTFSNDKYPPSKDKSKWGKITVKRGAAIGMGAIILPDVMIGENSFVGAGAIVTHSVPDGEKWYGSPATAHGKWLHEEA